MTLEDILPNLRHDRRIGYRDKTMGWVAAYKWFRHYKEGWKSLEDDPWMGRPVAACNKEATAHVWESSERTRDKKHNIHKTMNIGIFHHQHKVICCKFLHVGQPTITLHQPVSPLIPVSDQNGITMPSQAMYSLDPDPADSYLFPRMKHLVKRGRFQSADKINEATTST